MAELVGCVNIPDDTKVIVVNELSSGKFVSDVYIQDEEDKIVFLFAKSIWIGTDEIKKG